MRLILEILRYMYSPMSALRVDVKLDVVPRNYDIADTDSGLFRWLSILPVLFEPANGALLFRYEAEDLFKPVCRQLTHAGVWVADFGFCLGGHAVTGITVAGFTETVAADPRGHKNIERFKYKCEDSWKMRGKFKKFTIMCAKATEPNLHLLVSRA